MNQAFVYMIVEIGQPGELDRPTRKLFLYQSVAERVCAILNDFGGKLVTRKFRVESVPVNTVG